jgi:hypothetical protein
MADGLGGRLDKEVQNFEEKPSPSLSFSTSYPLWCASRNLTLNARVNVLISGAHGH